MLARPFAALLLAISVTGCASATVPTVTAIPSPTGSSATATSVSSPALTIAASPTDAPSPTTAAASPTSAPPTAADVPPTSTSAPPTATALPPTATSAAIAGLGQRTKAAGCQVRGPLPDPDCSPGAIFPSATSAQICVPGYASSVRDVPTSEKDQVYAEYGITSHTAGQYEVDHLISLELGGSNDVANLWPEAAEPRPGFHEKDKVENWLHDQVCAGKIPLHQAQVEISTNWLKIYEQMGGSSVPVAATPTPMSAPSPATSPATPTSAPVAPTATPAPAASSSSHTYYLSSYRTAHEYYCDDDPGWHSLSTKYLVHLPSEAAVHQQYPTYTLHRPC